MGYYHYRRRVRIHGHLRAKRFYGLRVSAQRCDRRHCWGPTVHGKLWSPHQPGRPLRRSRTAAAPAACRSSGRPLPAGHAACAAPGTGSRSSSTPVSASWYADSSNPCAKGGLEGGGVVAATDLSARILLEGGVLTAARAGSAFAGPPGIALGALSGCMVGEAAGGVHTVKALVDHLNPFDPRGPLLVARLQRVRASRITLEVVSWTIGILVIVGLTLRSWPWLITLAGHGPEPASPGGSDGGDTCRLRPGSAGGGALGVVVVVRLHPGHQLAQLAAGLLDRVLPRPSARSALNSGATGVLVVDEPLGERAVLDLAPGPPSCSPSRARRSPAGRRRSRRTPRCRRPTSAAWRCRPRTSGRRSASARAGTRSRRPRAGSRPR